MAKKATRFKNPYVASLDQVRITRQPDGKTALIEYAEDGVSGVSFGIGPEIAEMSDQEILNLHNDCLAAQADLRRDYDHVAVEIPMGKPQIEFRPESQTWVPRGGVVRVVIDDDMESDGDPSFIVDDTELTLAEFGRMLHVYNGWGMRIAFVPDDELYVPPVIEVRERDAEGR